MTNKIEKQARNFAANYNLDYHRVKNLYTAFKTIQWLFPNFPERTPLDLFIPGYEPEHVFESFEKLDLEKFSRRIYYFYKFSSIFPIHSIEGIINYFKTSMIYLLKNKNELIHTGYPRYVDDFSPSNITPLFLYPIREPLSISTFRSKSGELAILYPWDNIEYIREYIDEKGNYKNVFLPDKYKIAPLFKNLKPHKILDTIDSIRSKWLEIMINKFISITQSTHYERNIIERLFIELSEKFNSTDISLMLVLDINYYNLDNFLIAHYFKFSCLNACGFVNFIFDIASLDEELEYAKMKKTMEPIRKTITYDEWGRPHLSPIWLDRILHEKDTVLFDQAIYIYENLSHLNDYYDRFQPRIFALLKDHFNIHYESEKIVNKSFNIKLDYHELFTFFNSNKKFQKQDNTGQFKISNLQSNDRKDNNDIGMTLIRPKKFPHIPTLKWEEVRITFISNDSVRIEARGKSETFHYGEMGFRDGRKVDAADSRWGILKLLFARYDGRLPLENVRKMKQKDRENLKAAVKVIRKRLKVFFNINDDPFQPHYQIRNEQLAYKTKFYLKDNTPKESHYDNSDD